METPTVILHTNNPKGCLEALEARHETIPVYVCGTDARLSSMIAETGADVVHSIAFDGKRAFPRAALIDSPHVKWISVGGSGTDHLQPWNPAKVCVTNTAGISADMMAQYVLGVMLHFSLGLGDFRSAQSRQEWAPKDLEPIEGKTVLILGLGKTGVAVGARAKAQGLSCLGVRARPRPTSGIDEVHGPDALADLWSRAHFIVVCVPLLESTRGLVGRAAFEAMRPDAVVIDVSRGHVIDGDALLDALDGRLIRGAALDVFTQEPLPRGHRLWGYDNVIITPHCSSNFAGWELKSMEMFSENLWRYRRGEPLDNVVDPARGY